MEKFREVKPFNKGGGTLFEVYFSKFFPVEKLISKRILRRTKYGVTLTKFFKEKIIREMERLQSDRALILNFTERKYLDIKLEDLWGPIVSAICELNGCKCRIEGNKAYAELNKASTVEMYASAIYQWFAHVKNLLEKAKENNVEIKGNYV